MNNKITNEINEKKEEDDSDMYSRDENENDNEMQDKLLTNCIFIF
jgi:hypothetical protein